MSQNLNIKTYISNNSKCPFCKKNLIPYLDLLLSNNDFLENKSFKAKNNNIKIKLFYNKSIIFNAIIDFSDNIIVFNLSKIKKYEKDDIYDSFFFSAPRLELACINKQCKTNYYISSEILEIKINSISNNQCLASILPFSQIYEACNIDEFWVQNIFSEHKTKILLSNNPNVKNITSSFLDFKYISKELLLSKIKIMSYFN